MLKKIVTQSIGKLKAIKASTITDESEIIVDNPDVIDTPNANKDTQNLQSQSETNNTNNPINAKKTKQEEILSQIIANQKRKKEKEKENKIIIERATLLCKKALELAGNDLTLAKNSLVIAKNNLLKKIKKGAYINLSALDLAIEWIERQISKQKGEFIITSTTKEELSTKKLTKQIK